MQYGSVIWAVVAGFIVSGCMVDNENPRLPASDLYDRIPILSRDSFDVEITGKIEACNHPLMSQSFDCFAGITASGKKIMFDRGIEGYEFRPGVKETIGIEEIRYDFSAPTAPMDMSSLRYVFQG